MGTASASTSRRTSGIRSATITAAGMSGPSPARTMPMASVPAQPLQALDGTTGAVLWQCNTGSGVIGSPIAWEQDGEQIVHNFNQGGSVWGFKLVE